jgi:NADH-quinone oxidoreductase subunit C
MTDLTQATPPEMPGEPIVIGERRGMFGATAGQDTSGYGGLVVPIEFPGASARPYGGWFDAFIDTLAAGLEAEGTAYGDAVQMVVVDRGEITVHVAREHLPVVARVLRDEPALRFEICTGVSGVHYPGLSGQELHAIYHFLSITTAASEFASRSAAPTPIRTFPRSSRPTPPTPGTSVRPGTCSASSSTGTRR